MFGMLGMFGIFGNGNNEPTTEGESMDNDSVLTKEEIRKRRLVRVRETDTSPVESIGNTKSLLEEEDICMETSTSTTLSAASSPTPSAKSYTATTPLQASSSPSSLAASTSASSSSTSSSASTASTSTGQKVNLQAKALSKVLEYSLHATIRDPATKIDDNDSLYHVNIEGDEITTANLSDVLNSILTHHNLAEHHGAVGYLGCCYRNLISKEGSLVTEKIRDDYNSCKRTIISYLVSTMMLPEKYDHNSINAIDQFVKFMMSLSSNDSYHIIMNSLLRDVTEELSQQGCLDDIINKIIDMIVNVMLIPPSQGVRSVMDDHASTNTMIRRFVSADKRLCASLTQHHHFLLSSSISDADVSHEVDTMMIYDTASVERYAVRGAAIPHHTIIGIILRPSPDPDDPQLHMMLHDAEHQHSSILHGHISSIRNILSSNQAAAADIILTLLKAGPKPKEAAIQWIIDAIIYNREAAKDQPSPLLAAKPGFFVNLGAVMLQICRPIINDIEKINKIEWDYLASDEGITIFPIDDTKLFITEADARNIIISPSSSSPSTYNFITQSFFLCWRVLHFGFVQLCDDYITISRDFDDYQDGLDNNEPQPVDALLAKIIYDIQLLEPNLILDLLQYCSAAASAFIRCFDTDMISKVSTSSWLVHPNTLSPNQYRILQLMSEHMVNDLLSILLFVGCVDPSSLAKVSLESILSLIMFFLRRPWAIKSPHLRAMLGLILMQVYLPIAEMSSSDYWSHQHNLRDGPHSSLLSSHSDCQHFLAPALLLLYGDVEKTGFYEKLTNRRSIMIVLKHLWTLPTHRAAFRGIVHSMDEYNDTTISFLSSSSSTSSTGVDDTMTSSTPSSSQNYFMRFANGMMNEANSLAASTMEKLAEIKKTQDEMKSAEWHHKTEEQREQVMEKYEETESECRGCAGVCLETLNMLNYLTSDEVIRVPFIEDDAILSQFVDTLLSVLFKLVGSKSLEIKVDNMESYNFHPKIMLREIALAMLNFADNPKFQRAVRMNSFYKNDEEFRKAIATIHRLHLLQPHEEEKLTQLMEAVAKIEDYVEALKVLENEAPDEFLDALMFFIMKDPVLLPTSYMIVDRSTIARQLLNNEIDPFNRKPLKIEMVIPQLELQERIKLWLQSKLGAQFSLS